MDWDELVQREHPLTWPTLILKDLRTILKKLLPLFNSCILGIKYEKCVSFILLIMVIIDWRSIARHPFSLLNVAIHLLFVFLEIRVSMGGSHYYLLLLRTILFRVWFTSHLRRWHTRHILWFSDDIVKWYLYFTNSTMYRTGKIFHPLDDRERICNIWYVQYILSPPLNRDLPLLLEVLDYYVPMCHGVVDGYLHCLEE